MAEFVKSRVMLSPSALNLFLDCERCFWLEKARKIKRPRGIFPSLPGGMDRIVKTYFDVSRGELISPPELSGTEFEGISLFPNQKQLDLWRDWRTGLRREAEGGAVLLGALDDLLVKGDRFIPFDYKTKGSPASEEDAVRYYQNQMDCYALLLEGNRMPTEPYAFLCYFSPKKMEHDGIVSFEVQLIKVATRFERARETFARALKLLSGPEPPKKPGCEYCSWLAAASAGASGAPNRL